MRKMVRLCLSGLVCCMSWDVMAADPLSEAIIEQRTADTQSIESQKRVEQLDDETRQMLEAYRQITQDLQRLKRQNDQRDRLVKAQTEELQQIETQLETLEATGSEIEPLMERMLQVLERFVVLDTPFLQEERRLRIDQLQTLIAQADASLSEKYRRLLEAYQIETEYGRTIEAYRGVLQGDEEGRMVEFLRVGRVALYYRSLDGDLAGIWNVESGAWEMLETEYHRDIEQAIRIARKQLPPDLMPLPLFSPYQGERR